MLNIINCLQNRSNVEIINGFGAFPERFVENFIDSIRGAESLLIFRILRQFVSEFGNSLKTAFLDRAGDSCRGSKGFVCNTGDRKQRDFGFILVNKIDYTAF